MQHESCELSFIWGKMRTIAQETTFQMSLRNSKEVGGKVSIYVILVKAEYMQPNIFLQTVSASHEEQMSP